MPPRASSRSPARAAPPGPRYFRTAAEFRAWLDKHHASAMELLVGFHKVGSGTPSITWPESVAEALCYGWIDGIRRRIDEDRYSIRFTPRRRGSTWSAVNIRLAQELEAAGRMTPAGRAVFEARIEGKSATYTYEQIRSCPGLPEAMVREFRKNKAAWAFFECQAPSYRRKVSWWVVSGKQEETRRRRLAKLIAFSAAGRLVV